MTARVRITDVRETELGFYLSIKFDLLNEAGERGQGLIETCRYYETECDGNGSLNALKAYDRAVEHLTAQGYEVAD